MKRRILPFLLLFGVLLCATSLTAQRIITVDSDTSNVAMYHDFQEAYNAAEDGDTLLVQGRFWSSYDIYKQLTIKSAGDSIADLSGLNLRLDPAIGEGQVTLSPDGTLDLSIDAEDDMFFMILEAK